MAARGVKTGNYAPASHLTVTFRQSIGQSEEIREHLQIGLFPFAMLYGACKGLFFGTVGNCFIVGVGLVRLFGCL
jgi:hypothetical protein